MLIEVKTKVSMIVDNKPRKTTDTYLVEKEFFSEAEYTVTKLLSGETVQGFEIQSLRISPIRELATQFSGEHSFIATLRDIWTDDKGNEKYLRYKVLLWADNLTQANQRVQELSKEGYDMLVEGIRQVDYIYVTE